MAKRVTRAGAARRGRQGKPPGSGKPLAARAQASGGSAESYSSIDRETRSSPDGRFEVRHRVAQTHEEAFYAHMYADSADEETYEHRWEVVHVPSGAVIATFEGTGPRGHATSGCRTVGFTADGLAVVAERADGAVERVALLEPKAPAPSTAREPRRSRRV